MGAGQWEEGGGRRAMGAGGWKEEGHMLWRRCEGAVKGGRGGGGGRWRQGVCPLEWTGDRDRRLDVRRTQQEGAYAGGSNLPRAPHAPVSRGCKGGAVTRPVRCEALLWFCIALFCTALFCTALLWFCMCDIDVGGVSSLHVEILYIRGTGLGPKMRPQNEGTLVFRAVSRCFALFRAVSRCFAPEGVRHPLC